MCTKSSVYGNAARRPTRMSVHGGILQFDAGPVDERLLASLELGSAKYSDDVSSTYLGGQLGAFFRPFHTTSDSRRERQPFVSHEGNIFLWDGVLDNREEVISSVRNVDANGKTDVALIAALYERAGDRCFGQIRGDWALAVWNPFAKTLDLAVDYMGIRHLYYYLSDSKLVWSTHLAGVAGCLRTPLPLNEEYMAGYLISFPDPALTPFENIRAVPPASVVHFQNQKPTIIRYWDDASLPVIHYKTDSEYEEHFFHAFRTAVRRRLSSDSPVLAELSGGLDSSSIVCMADHLIRNGEARTPRLDTISHYSVLEPGGDERSFFMEVEKRRGVQGFHINLDQYGHRFSLEYEDFEPTPNWVGKRPGLEQDMSDFFERQGNRVALSGIGGDEFLGGVPDPRPLLADLIFKCRLITFCKALLEWSSIKRIPLIQLLSHCSILLLPDRIQNAFGNQVNAPGWMAPQLVKRHSLEYTPHRRLSTLLPSRRESLRTVLAMRRQVGAIQPTSSLRIEYRYPYLEQSLIEFLISIPATQLLRPGQRRSLMRRALAGLVPPQILSRKSKARVIRHNLRAVETHWLQLERLFTSPLVEKCAFVNGKQLQEALLAA